MTDESEDLPGVVDDTAPTPRDGEIELQLQHTPDTEIEGSAWFDSGESDFWGFEDTFKRINVLELKAESAPPPKPTFEDAEPLTPPRILIPPAILDAASAHDLTPIPRGWAKRDLFLMTALSCVLLLLVILLSIR